MSKRKNEVSKQGSGPKAKGGTAESSREAVRGGATPDTIRGGISRRAAIGIPLAVAGAAFAAWFLRNLGSPDGADQAVGDGGGGSAAPVGSVEAKRHSRLLDILPENDVRIPTFSEIGKTKNFQFSLPARFKDVDRDEFRESMLQLMVEKRFRDELLPKFRDGAVAFNEIWAFLNGLLRRNSYMTGMASDYSDLMASKSQRKYTYEDLLALANAYFLHAGLYLDLGEFSANGDCISELYRVSEVKTFKVEDDEMQDEINVLSLRDGVAGFQRQNAIDDIAGTFASYSFAGGYCLYNTEFVDVLAGPAEALSAKYNDHAALPRPFKEIVRASFIRHELVHGFLKKKFPKTSHEVHLDPGAPIFDLSLNLRPLSARTSFKAIELHELAAVAIELATSEEQCHYRFYTTGAWEKMTEDSTYYLAKILLPVAILKVAKDSGFRNQALSDLEAGRINYEALRQVFMAPNWTIEDTKKVGQLLYNFAHKAFEQIEMMGGAAAGH